ncbi:serine protease FAM111A [Siphateles boraxobius]|uniref:serine protease FAM111A n=1 Tax=Siphateles boraxobius TaxID=180520 RepID=UPI0040648B6A
MTVREALNTMPIFLSEKDKQKNNQKEILIQRSNGKDPRAAVTTDFPCCLIEDDEILDITFIQKDGNSSTNQQTTADPSVLSKRSKPETLVTFLVEKEGGPTVTCLLKSKVTNEASDADAAENVGQSQNPINPEQKKKHDGNTTKSTNPSTKRYVAKPIDKSEEIAEILRDQCEDLWKTVKQREKLKNNSEVQKFFREEYHKSAENFLEVKKVRELLRLSDSVCQIRVGESPAGTGFLLFDRFILTNAHVIGECDIFSTKTFTAVFGYECLEAKETKHIPVKQLKAYFHGKDASGRHLDYALLELDSVNEIAECPKLLDSYSPNPPNRGQICIVGHPGEGVKKMDPCIIIERDNRLEAANKHISENKHLIHVMKEVCAEQKWDFLAYKNQFTYDTCFFHGSSGSPVFDEHCKLIGIHTGGYKYKKLISVMEYGFTMQPILDHIKAQAKIKGLHEIINKLEAYSNKSNVSGAADQENQTDIEMDDEEEPEES